MEKIDASLKAELDLSTWNKQIRRLIKAEVRGERKRGNITLRKKIQVKMLYSCSMV
jgi:hypothetical protein